MQFSRILELVPAAIGVFLATVLLLTAFMVVVARLKRAFFGVRVGENGKRPGSFQDFLSNFD
jgi:hypothetical protein